MTNAMPEPSNLRADFHQQHAQRAEQEALRLFAERQALGPRWLSWVAGELYQLTPAPYANMVRRALAQLNKDGH